MTKSNPTTKHPPLATEFSRTGKRNGINRKPYRTAEQKAEARATAELIDGRWVSRAPVSYHTSVFTPTN